MPAPNDTDCLKLVSACSEFPHDSPSKRELAEWLTLHGEPEAATCLWNSVAEQRRIDLPSAVRERWEPLSFFELGFAGWQAKSVSDFLENDPGPWEAAVSIKGPFGADGMSTFLASPRLGNIRVLELRNNGIWDEAGVQFARSRQLRQVVSLKAGWNKFSDAGAEALASCQALDGLRVLDLSGNAINHGILHLVRSPLLRCLTHLDLSDNGVGDEGLEALVEAGFDDIVSLQLKQSGIGEAGALALAGSAGFTKLVSLNLAKNALGTLGAARIRERFPFAKV